MPDKKQPFFQLGELLRKLRTASDKSAEEVSAAIEISDGQLQRIEQGASRPSEEVLLMLIQHFQVSDQQAMKLWSLAGFSGGPEVSELFSFDEHSENLNTPEHRGEPNILAGFPSTISVGLNLKDLHNSDPRIIYTDFAKVEINNFGVVMNFMQMSGAPDSEPLTVSRIGMSREHAERVMQMLRKTLDQFDKDTSQPPELKVKKVQAKKSPSAMKDESSPKTPSKPKGTDAGKNSEK